MMQTEAISPEALAAFKRMLELDDRCKCDRDDFYSPVCRACNSWWKAHRVLEAELGVKDDWPCVQKPTGKPTNAAEKRYVMMCKAVSRS